jgi:rod shape determining protein RodA
MLWMSGASLRWLAVLAVGVAAMVPVAWTYLLRDYQKARLEAFFNAAPDIQGAGFQLHQAQIAVGAGGSHRQGPDERDADPGAYLPVQATDFVFATLAEELGFIVASSCSYSSPPALARPRGRMAIARCVRHVSSRQASAR